MEITIWHARLLLLLVGFIATVLYFLPDLRMKNYFSRIAALEALESHFRAIRAGMATPAKKIEHEIKEMGEREFERFIYRQWLPVNDCMAQSKWSKYLQGRQFLRVEIFPGEGIPESQPGENTERIIYRKEPRYDLELTPTPQGEN